MILRKKCKVCDGKIKSKEPAIIRLETADGIHEINVCDECSRFFEKSAEVIQGGRKKEPEEDDE